MPDPGDPRTVGFCGAGMIAAVHALATDRLGLRPIAVASRRSASAARLAARLGAEVVSYDDLVGRADVVIVATPPAQHATDAIRHLRAGSAVVLEKPMCRTLAEADAIVAAVDEHQDRLLYAENLAYAPLVQRFLGLTRTIGALERIEVRALQALPTWGQFTTDEWGGGALFDLGVHPLAVALLAAGDDRLDSVSGRLRGGPGHDSDEHAEVVLRFASGLVAEVTASWQGGPDPVWDAQASSATGVVRAELFPTPALEHNGEPIEPGMTGAAGELVVEAGYLAQLGVFCSDLRAERSPFMNARFARWVLEVVAAAYWSAGRAGEPIRFPTEVPRDRTLLELWRLSPR